MKIPDTGHTFYKMPWSYAADSYTNRASHDCPYRLFRFPLSDRDRCRRGIASVCHRRQTDWWPNSGMRICGPRFLKEEPCEDT